MAFGNIVMSPRGSLSPEKSLELANIYLENAFSATDSDIALVLCHDTELSLYQANKSAKHEKNQTVRGEIATAYVGLGKLLESLHQVKGAQASFKKARKLGGNVHDLARPTDTYRPSSIKESFERTLDSFAETSRSVAGTLDPAEESLDLATEALDPAAETLDPATQALDPVAETLDPVAESLDPATETLDSLTGSHDDSAKPPPLDQRQCSKAIMVDLTVPAYIFVKNIRPPIIEAKLPEPDERLINTPQLVCCLGLLKMAHSPDTKLQSAALKWMKVIEKDTDEQERLHGIATDVIRAFKREEIKDAKVVAEVVCLAPVLDKDTFHDLLRGFYSGIDHSGLLSFQELEGLARLIQGADHGHLSADDLVKILELLSTRLMDTHQQSSEHMYQLTMAVSNVLDAMADTKVTDLNRERLHEPLSSYLSGLKESDDPFLVYQAAYAYQALLCVPDDETKWQAAMRRTGKVIQGVSGMVSAVKGFDLAKLIQGLGDIQKGVSGVTNVVGVVKSTYNGVTSLIAGGKGLVESLQEGFSFTQKRDWYSALRGADALIRDGELATFRKLVCEVPCRLDPAFQWGVCQRLGEMAANPMWDDKIRRSAIAFLGEIYKNDEMWGQEASIKQWILNILMQLSSSSGGLSPVHSAAAETILQELEASVNIEKGALYRACREDGPIAYPLKVTLPELASPSLLDRVQNKPDVDGHLRILRKKRTKERGDAVYIQPQAKSSLQAADDARFPLMDKVKKFLGSEQKVFLLLGDSGAGKSTFGRELEFDLWLSYKSRTDRIPLHINLPTIDKPELDLIAKQLRRDEFTEPQIREMKHHRKFILICDGYDESQQTHNLYMSNKLNQPDEWDAQMVISCRTEYLGSDYRDRFQPGSRNQQLQSPLFQEAVITPFSLNQIHDYIKQYVDVNQPLWRQKDYEQALNLIPSLKELVKNPFLMTLSLDVLPRMVDPGQHLSSAHITRVALYDHFVEQWLERGKKRLAEKDMSSFTKEAFEKLSAEGFTLNGIGYLKKFAVAIYKEQDGQPVVKYSKLADSGSWKDEFFSCKEMRLLHEACPLTRNGNQHQFIHRSLLEYGLARAVFDPQDRENGTTLEPVSTRRGSVGSIQSFDASKEIATNPEQDPNLNSPLVWRSFVNDYSLMEFLEERVRQEQVFKHQLLAYIEHSKKDRKWRTAAANAITILVRAGVQFIDTDLRGIQIPGADLSYGVFDSVQLQEADMRKVNLRGAWLRQTDLSGTDMTGAKFGELPYLTVGEAVRSCAFSPDGESLAIGLKSGVINVYSTVNWDMIRTWKGHDKLIAKIVYSPDGNLIVSGSWDGTAQIWVKESGVSKHALTDHAGKINCVAYSPHGDQVASGSEDNTIRLWDPEIGNCVQILSGHEQEVLCVIYSPKGDLIASGSADRTVRLWNVASGECSSIYTFDGHNEKVLGITFSPQGDQVASASADMTIRLWDVESRKCRHTLEGHAAKVNDVVYSPKGDQAFSGSLDGTVRVWDVQSGICLYTMTGHGDEVSCVAYSPKGDMLASGSLDRTVRLWDVSVGGSRHIPNGHIQQVWDVKCSPQGDMIATCSDDRTIRLWDLETGTCRRTLSGHGGAVFSIAYSPQGNQIGSGSADKTIRLWNLETGTCQHVLTGHSNDVYSIAYSPQGDQVASASIDETVRLWNVSTGHSETLGIHESRLLRAMYSPDGRLIATSGVDGTVGLWSVETMANIGTLKGHRGWVHDVVFSPQGDQLASAGDDREVRLWNVETRDCRVLIGHGHAVFSVAYSHKGDLLASGSRDKTVRLWNVASGECRAVVQNFQGSILRVAWIPSAEAQYLVTGCQDGSVLKWQITEEEDECDVTLRWCATRGTFTVAGASIQDVRGLTPLNEQLLKQRGDVGEPENPFRVTIVAKTVRIVREMWSVCDGQVYRMYEDSD
ncbi:hypothetical protein BGX34_008876 [Mortierella sp. NVP85]|nr:hypothetical protein BGX34_008876 [Mortierella sp. NVP85]